MKTPKFPIDYEAIRKAISNEVQRATGLVCILSEPEEPNSPRPPKPYFSMKFTSPAVKEGDDSRQTVLDVNGNPTTLVNIGGQRKLTVSFQCYGKSHEQAYNYLTLWQASLETETTQAKLSVAGIAVWLNGSVADLSALLNTGYEGRAQMDVEFGVASNITEDQGAIETVHLSGNVDIGDGTIEEVDVDVYP